MTKHPRPYVTLAAALKATNTLWIQAPLPDCLDTLPILITIPGPGSVLAGCAPSAPPEEPANDK